jgi:hypothetical protein
VRQLLDSTRAPRLSRVFLAFPWSQSRKYWWESWGSGPVPALGSVWLLDTLPQNQAPTHTARLLYPAQIHTGSGSAKKGVP